MIKHKKSKERNMKKLILGISLIILSIVLYISKNYFSKQETTNFDKFSSGILIGLSIGIFLVGIVMIICYIFEKNKKDIRNLYKNFESAFQKVGIVKYDAFNQMGGNLSFSLALLDENNNGFILNSVHSTDGCYSYTKQIENGICKISLGDEEERALNIAMGITN